MGFDDLFEKGNDSKQREKRIEKIDFDSFVEKVKQMPFEEGQVALWTEAYKLPSWRILIKEAPKTGDRTASPVLVKTDGKLWFLAFTDGEHAGEFAKDQKLVDESGSSYNLAMKPLDAAEWMCEQSNIGIYGVRFNEGDHGWFAPLTNLLPMYQYIKDLKKKQN